MMDTWLITPVRQSETNPELWLGRCISDRGVEESLMYMRMTVDPDTADWLLPLSGETQVGAMFVGSVSDESNFEFLAQMYNTEIDEMISEKKGF